MNVSEEIRITWSNREEFLEAYDDSGRGRYTIKASRPGMLPDKVKGDIVLVSLAFADDDKSFRHRATIIAVSEQEMTLEFIEGDSETRDLIVCFAGGEAVPYLHRRVERRQTWISTVVKIDGDWKSAIITELAELGAFLGLVDPPAKGTDVVLRLATHDGKEVDLVGTVVYQVLDHEKGCGIEFVFDGHRDEASKREFIRQALSSEGE